MTATIHHGDCLTVMAAMPESSIDAIVTDPPYGLGFMGRKWDALPPGKEWAEECLRVLKPGGHLVAFGGTRTWHRLAVAIEDAGLEIRDSIAWMHGQGFPRSKAGLKPSHEPAVLARKKPAPGGGLLNVEAARNDTGRWPANVALDEHMAAELDQQSGYQKDGVAVNRNKDPDAEKPSSIYGRYRNGTTEDRTYGAGGGASRFFYVPKAPKRERPEVDGIKHPTVKPLALMRWLVRLATPPGGIVLDPFAGSGTTIEAAMLEGFQVVGIEREAEYLPLIHERIRRATEQLATEDPEQGSFSFEETA